MPVLFIVGPSLPALADDVSATSRIDAVQVFPSGAEVTRRAEVDLQPGSHVVIFTDLPAQAIARSIRVEGSATGNLELGAIDSRRRHIPHADGATAASERRRREDEIQRLKDERTLLKGELEAAETQRKLITNLSELPKQPAPPAAPGQSAGAQDWSQVLGLIGTGMADIRRIMLDVNVKTRDLNRKITDLQKELNALSPKRKERTEVKVHVTADKALKANLTIRYQISSASWSPFYDARLATGSKTQPPKLELTRRATITQRSGESWDDVEVVLSTTRPKAGSSAPELQTLTVDYEPEPRPVPMAEAAPAPPAEFDDMAQEKRMVSKQARGGRARTLAAAKPVRVRERKAAVVNAPFQALFKVPGRVSVADTGEAKRVQLLVDKLEPRLGVQTVPKRDAKAYLYATFKLPKGAPLLAGPVSLFRDGTFVGSGRLPILVGDVEHKLGFGIDDLVRVRYTVQTQKRGEEGLISTSQTDKRDYRISVKNLHERAMHLIVLDQIPVSKNEDIRVELTARRKPTSRDYDNKRGVLSWESEIKPEEEIIIDFGYRVLWPAEKRIVYGR